MKNFKLFATRFAQEESGQDLIEYALVAALVGLGCVAAMSGLSTAISNTFGSIGNEMTNATS